MNIEIQKSKVYVLLDSQNRVTRCEGGYTTPTDLSGWVQIDEGNGDRYNLCQSHYFDGGLYTMDGIPRYKLADGAPVLRTDAEIEADRAAIPTPVIPPTNEKLAAQLVECKKENKLLKAQVSAATERSDFIEDCIAEMAVMVYSDEV